MIYFGKHFSCMLQECCCVLPPTQPWCPLGKKSKQAKKASQAELSTLGVGHWLAPQYTFALTGHTTKKVIESFLTKHIPKRKRKQSPSCIWLTIQTNYQVTEDKRLTILINNPLIFSYCANKVLMKPVWCDGILKSAFFLPCRRDIMHRRLWEVIHTAHFSSTKPPLSTITVGKISLAQQLLDPNLFTVKNTLTKKQNSRYSPIQHWKKASQSKKGDIDHKEQEGKPSPEKQSSKPIQTHKQQYYFKHSEQTKYLDVSNLLINIEIIKAYLMELTSRCWKTMSKKAQQSTIPTKARPTIKDLPHTSWPNNDTNSHLTLLNTRTSKKWKCKFWLEEPATEFNEKRLQKS